MKKETVAMFSERIKGQLSRFLDFEEGENAAVIAITMTGLAH